MDRSEQPIRVLFSTLAGLAAALFAFGYNDIHYHNAVTHLGLSGGLPQLTHLVIKIVPWAFIVPVAVLVGSWIWRQRPRVVYAITSAGWLFALGWPLACILGWECPSILL